MKVIGFTGNYGMEDSVPQSYLMADSSILYTGRPFFLPDFARQFVATPTIVVRTGRLGKCIAPKFAHRYWDAFTAGFAVRAIQGDDDSSAALDRAFDGAAIVGEWVEASHVEDMMHEPVEVTIDGTVVSSHCLADMNPLPLADMLARVSIRCSVKMGDMLFTGNAGEEKTLTAGTRLAASIGGRQVLDVKVRL